ncbi:MAG: (d)CMP kinase [Pseudomonadota bacterium]
MIIAVDGHAASGKGTFAKRIAQHFGFHYLDTGKLYRAVALSVLNAGEDPDNAAAAGAAAAHLELSWLSHPDIELEATGGAASQVAVHEDVRGALTSFQRDFGRKPPGAILDGRDIGTVICPDAELKFFITATAHERALRRLKQLGEDASNPDRVQAMQAEIEARDHRDQTRAVAPLKPAKDALLLDTTNRDIDAIVEWGVAEVGKVLAARNVEAPIT